MSADAATLGIGDTIQNMTNVLQDYARIQSIHDITRNDAFAIAMDLTKTNQVSIGYFKVVVLSTRVQEYCLNTLHIDWFTCVTYSDPANDKYWSEGPDGFEDPGGPGNSVLIGVDFNHPLITPFLMQAWPYIHLTTYREGIVENFRSSKTVNIALPLSMNTPTASLTPSITNTPTHTNTPTNTQSPTPTETFTPTTTLTPSNTPSPTITLTPSRTPTPTITPSITLTPTRTLTPSLTPTPDCGDITMDLGIYPGRTDRLRAVITNNNSVAALFGTVTITWDSSTGNSNKYVDYIDLNTTRIYGGNDNTSTTIVTKTGTGRISLAGNAVHNMYIDYAPDSRGISGTFIVDIDVTVGSLSCSMADSYSRVGPTATNTRTPTRTATRTNTLPPSRTPTITLTPTITFTPSDTPIPPTPTRTATRTNTVPPTNTLPPTNTPVPPTATRTATRTSTATKTTVPSATSTRTPAPSPTATRTPTRTPTNTPSGCGVDC